MPIAVTELSALTLQDLRNYMAPAPVATERGTLMLQLAVEAVQDAVSPRTEVPIGARAIVLEAASRGVGGRVQQESLGARSVSYASAPDGRTGVFLTDGELVQLGLAPASGGGLGLGVIRTQPSSWVDEPRALDAERRP